MSYRILLNYFPDLTDLQKEQFAQMEEVYAFWNQKINVLSRKDIDQLYLRHVLHCLGIAKVIQFVPNTKILDVGTGGGFPGIPLAIVFPDCQFHLVDSIGKKIKVVNCVTEALKLKNVTAEHTRVEHVKAQFDFVLSRAVTRLNPFCQWVQSKVNRKGFNYLDNGILCLKGGDLEEELKEVNKPHQLFNLSDFFREDFFKTKKIVYISFI